MCVNVCHRAGGACLQPLNDSVAWLRSGDLLYWCRVAECARWKPPVKDWHVGTPRRRVSPSSVTFLWVSLSIMPGTFTFPLSPRPIFTRPSFQRVGNPQVNPHCTDTPLPPFHLLLLLPPCQAPSPFSPPAPALSPVPSSLPAHSVSGPPRPEGRCISHISDWALLTATLAVFFSLSKGEHEFFPYRIKTEMKTVGTPTTVKIVKPDETFHKFVGRIPHIKMWNKCIWTSTQFHSWSYIHLK